MKKDKGIVIKNIYYMLSYAFKILNQSVYEEVAAEEFDDMYNLFSAICQRGLDCSLSRDCIGNIGTARMNCLPCAEKLICRARSETGWGHEKGC